MTTTPEITYYGKACKLLWETIIELAPPFERDNLEAYYKELQADELLTSQDIACKLTYILNIGLQFARWRH